MSSTPRPEPSAIETDFRTHWDGCWEHRGHHECAIARVRELEAARSPGRERSAWLRDREGSVNLKRCPQCDALALEGEAVCSICGHEPEDDTTWRAALSAVPGQPSAESAPTPLGGLYCMECATEEMEAPPRSTPGCDNAAMWCMPVGAGGRAEPPARPPATEGGDRREGTAVHPGDVATPAVEEAGSGNPYRSATHESSAAGEPPARGPSVPEGSEGSGEQAEGEASPGGSLVERLRRRYTAWVCDQAGEDDYATTRFFLLAIADELDRTFYYATPAEDVAQVLRSEALRSEMDR